MQPCRQCGAYSEEDQRFCYNCGARLEQAAAPPAPAVPTIPGPPPPAPLQQSNYSPPPPAYTNSQVIPNSNLAIISLIAGILTWTVLPIVLPAIAAIITGHMARNEIRNSGGTLTGDGLALLGLILGYAQVALVALGVCFFLLIFVIALVA
ncbi:MAG: DUF4190 domain-containing protein [Candidatus Viridilinea halotolerans]|uniref:DUF4190 domain-containing protein n=1 Tax=Candidatus Viridilinea halotolerans TaxID=2491704 RepID=A0A426U4E1_9CHLR|nr:MAG: DUF4190 domain-containing protein [Candidatus Viridilinea halotolerans]